MNGRGRKGKFTKLMLSRAFLGGRGAQALWIAFLGKTEASRADRTPRSVGSLSPPTARSTLCGRLFAYCEPIFHSSNSCSSSARGRTSGSRAKSNRQQIPPVAGARNRNPAPPRSVLPELSIPGFRSSPNAHEAAARWLRLSLTLLHAYSASVAQ